MDSMFPSQGNPPAPMLKEIRGSAKRAINYLWYTVGELGLDGNEGRIYIEIVGTAGSDHAEVATSPISYDVIGATTDDIFSEADTPDHRGGVEFLAGLYGLPVDARSWTVIEPERVERIAINRHA